MGEHLQINKAVTLCLHVNTNQSQAPDKLKHDFTPNARAQLETWRKRKTALRQRLFKQRRHRDSNPVLETRSANHQHLLLFFKKS